MLCSTHQKAIKYIAISEKSIVSDENTFLCDDCALKCQQKDKTERIVSIFNLTDDKNEITFIKKRIKENLDNVVQFHHNLVSEFNQMINELIEELVKRLIIIKHANYKLIENWMKENQQKINHHFFSSPKIKTIHELSRLIQQGSSNQKIRSYYYSYQRQSKTVELISSLRYNQEYVNFFKTYLQQIQDIANDFDFSFKPQSIAFFASHSNMDIESQMNEISQQFIQQQANYYEFMLRRIQNTSKLNSQVENSHPVSISQHDNQQLPVSNLAQISQSTPALIKTQIDKHFSPPYSNFKVQPDSFSDLEFINGNSSKEVQNQKIREFSSPDQEDQSSIQIPMCQQNSIEKTQQTLIQQGQQIEIIDSNHERKEPLNHLLEIPQSQPKNQQISSSIPSSSSKAKGSEALISAPILFSQSNSPEKSFKNDWMSEKIGNQSKLESKQIQQITTEKEQKEVSKLKQDKQQGINQKQQKDSDNDKQVEISSQWLSYTNITFETNLIQSQESLHIIPEENNSISKQFLKSIEIVPLKEKQQDVLNQEAKNIDTQGKYDHLDKISDYSNKVLSEMNQLQIQQSGQNIQVIDDLLEEIFPDFSEISEAVPQITAPPQQQLTQEAALNQNHNQIKQPISISTEILNVTSQPSSSSTVEIEKSLNNNSSSYTQSINVTQKDQQENNQQNQLSPQKLNAKQIKSKKMSPDFIIIVDDNNQDGEEQISIQNRDTQSLQISVIDCDSHILSQNKQYEQSKQSEGSENKINQQGKIISTASEINPNKQQNNKLATSPSVLKESRKQEEIQSQKTPTFHIVRGVVQLKSTTNKIQDDIISKNNQKITEKGRQDNQENRIDQSFENDCSIIEYQGVNSNNQQQGYSMKDQNSELTPESSTTISEVQESSNKSPTFKNIKKVPQSRESTSEKIPSLTYDLPTQCVKRNLQNSEIQDEESFFKEPQTKKKIIVEIEEESNENHGQNTQQPDKLTQNIIPQIGKQIWFKNLKIIKKQDGSKEEQVKFKQFNSQIVNCQSKIEQQREGFSKRVIQVETIMKKERNSNSLNDELKKQKESQKLNESNQNMIIQSDCCENNIKIFKKKFVQDKKASKY